MKAEYIKPELMVVVINSSHLLAGSYESVCGRADADDIELGSKSSSFWDDDED